MDKKKKDEQIHDNVRHGVDDNPTGDAEKGAAIGGIGGAVVGGTAGAMTGPVGAVVGAVIGGVAGAVASGAAVAAVDQADNDNTVTGIGKGSSYERHDAEELHDDAYANPKAHDAQPLSPDEYAEAQKEARMSDSARKSSDNC